MHHGHHSSHGCAGCFVPIFLAFCFLTMRGVADGGMGLAIGIIAACLIAPGVLRGIKAGGTKGRH